VELGAAVVDEDPDKHAKLQTELDSIELINLMYDEAGDYINKILDHYDVDTWLDLSVDEALEIYNTLADRRKKLIGSTRLKRLHALGNEVQAITEDDWLWDEVRPVYVNQLTQGRTTSSKRLFVDEWTQLTDWLQSMLDGEEEGEELFSDG
jgi:asparagine synthetase A